jgi:hypothetical protein
MLWQLALGGLALLILSMARSGDLLRSVTLVSLLVALCLGIALIAMRTASLRADQDSGLVSVDALGRTTRLPRERLGGGERYSIRGLYGSTRYLLLRATDGSVALKLSGNFWDLAAVEDLCARQDIGFSGSYDTMFRPGAGPSGTTELSWTAWLVLSAFVLVFVAVALLAGLPGR